MPTRAIYIRLSPRELQLLEEMATAERRDIHDQAAHLVAEALLRWQSGPDIDFAEPLARLA